jgi:hypothetical protein
MLINFLFLLCMLELKLTYGSMFIESWKWLFYLDIDDGTNNLSNDSSEVSLGGGEGPDGGRTGNAADLAEHISIKASR